jgi:serine/threonine-protein kinase
LLYDAEMLISGTMSTNNTWSRVREVFLQALEHPASERSGFVNNVCGDDPEVLADVVSLLDAFEEQLEAAPEAKNSVVGTIIDGKYRIDALLGRGGMGAVYRGTHLKLQRPVALKFMREDTDIDRGDRERFEREARVVARLKHPNIVTIHDFGVSDSGRRYIVMEYLAGRTLRSFIEPGVGMEPVQAAAIASKVCQALRAAHAAGVVHRDLKPENIVLEPSADGELLVKVLDFGLAKLQTPLDSERASLTGSNVVVGTPAYMSPEQCHNDAIDARSDIYALGCVLYEMVTGRAPFTDTSPLKIMAKHASEVPVAPSRLRIDLPTELEIVILRAMAKDKKDRFQTAAEFADALGVASPLPPSGPRPPAVCRASSEAVTFLSTVESRLGEARSVREAIESAVTSRLTPPRRQPVAAAPAVVVPARRRLRRSWVVAFLVGAAVTTAAWWYWTTSETIANIRVVAVLPFANVNGSTEVEDLVNGIPESLIRDVSKIEGLSVKSPGTVARYRGTEVDPRVAGRELKVQALVTGRLETQGERLTVRVYIVETGVGNVLFGQSYTGTVADPLQLEEAITRDIVDELRRLIGAESVATHARRPTANPEAFREYLRGRYFWNNRTEADLKRAAASFQRAIDIDPGYALAYAGLADCHIVSIAQHPKDIYPFARAAAARALEIDPDLAEAHASLAAVLFWYEWKWADAEAEFRRAIQLDPNYATAHHWYAMFLMSRGRPEEAKTEITLAQQLDPLSLTISTVAGAVAVRSGDPTGGIAQLRDVISLAPEFAMAHYELGKVLAEQGRFDDALAAFTTASRYAADNAQYQAGLAYVLAASGRRAEATRLLTRLTSSRQYVSPFELACVYTALGDSDEALAQLRKAVEIRAWEVVNLVIDARLAPLRADPRFRGVLGPAFLAPGTN